MPFSKIGDVGQCCGCKTPSIANISYGFLGVEIFRSVWFVKIDVDVISGAEAVQMGPQHNPLPRTVNLPVNIVIDGPLD